MSTQIHDTLTLDNLQELIDGRSAAFRCRSELQPAGGSGSKVFPPTYSGAVYATEKRRLPGYDEPVECVLLDSVQSQANRMEEALQMAVDDGRLRLPVIEVDFGAYFPGEDKDESLRLLDPIGKVSSLQAPHRIADAILRDSLCDGKPFRASEIGRAIDRVNLRNATPLFELCPTALLFGMWDSTGPKGGLGAKFERAIVSEIVGIDAVYGVKTSSRIDPLGIQKEAGPVYYVGKKGSIEWTLNPEEAAKDGKGNPIKYDRGGTAGKPGNPSKANHGNITPSFSKYTKGAEGHDPLSQSGIDLRCHTLSKQQQHELSLRIREQHQEAREGRIAPGGVTISHAEQTIVISLPALRRLRFPPKGESWQSSPDQHERDKAARTVLTALGLCAAVLADESGLDLRSRCLLYPEQPLTWEVLGRGSEQSFSLSADEAIELFHQAVEKAMRLGLPWRTEPLVLEPSEQLVKLVVKSQNLAASQGGDGNGDE